jgi:hypothetical protein
MPTARSSVLFHDASELAGQPAKLSLLLAAPRYTVKEGIHCEGREGKGLFWSAHALPEKAMRTECRGVRGDVRLWCAS